MAIGGGEVLCRLSLAKENVSTGVISSDLVKSLGDLDERVGLDHRGDS